MSNIYTLEEFQEMRKPFPNSSIIFTNGCFDVLHVGHVRYLWGARRITGRGNLLVAINSDSSIKQLKGENRPINNQNDRAEIISSLRPVDGVIIFNEIRVTNLLKELKPNIYVKGGDYTEDTLDPNELDVLKEIGAKIVILPLFKGYSSTNIINKLNL